LNFSGARFNGPKIILIGRELIKSTTIEKLELRYDKMLIGCFGGKTGNFNGWRHAAKI
jgi:hypothetical protein